MTRAIDFLCNLFTPESIRRNYLRSEARDAFEATGRIKGLEGHEPQEFVSHLSSLGVERVVVTAIVTWSYWQQKAVELTTPEEVMRVAQEFPEAVFGLYGVNRGAGWKPLRSLKRVVREHGFKGLHIHPHGFGWPPNHAYYFPFYAKAEELDVPVVVSMGHTLDKMPIEPGRPAHLDEVALYFPQLRIVCAHTGWPWVEEAIALSRQSTRMCSWNLSICTTLLGCCTGPVYRFPTRPR